MTAALAWAGTPTGTGPSLPRYSDEPEQDPRERLR